VQWHPLICCGNGNGETAKGVSSRCCLVGVCGTSGFQIVWIDDRAMTTLLFDLSYLACRITSKHSVLVGV
jgi:hypothetical protein